MAKITRFDAALGQIPGRVENVAQQRMYGTLAERLKGFADRKNQQADIQVKEQARRMGEAAAAGTIGGVEISDDFTIKAQAFAEGARASHAAQIQVEIRDTVSKLERVNQFDVGAFEVELDGYRRGLMEEIDEQLVPGATSELNDYALRSRIRIEDNMFKQGQMEQMASITTAAKGMSDDALSSAYLGDEAMLQKKEQQYFAVLDSAVANNLMDPDDVAGMKLAFSDNVLIQNTTGVFDRTLQNEGLAAGEKAFDKFMKSKHRGVDPVVRDKIITRMRSSLTHERGRVRSEKTRADAEIKAREKALKRDVDNAKYALDHGYEVQNLPELIDVSRGTKYESELMLIGLHQDAVNEFVNTTPSEQKTLLDKTRTKNLSGEQIRLMERLQGVYDHTQGEIRAGRGMDLALQQGIISDVPPLDAPGSLEARRQLSKIASTHYEQPISPLTKGEVETLKANLDGATSDERITTLGQMVDGLGEDALPMLETLAGNNAGAYAIAGALMVEGRGHTGREMLKGADAIDAYPKIIPKDFDTELTAAIGSTYDRTPKQVEYTRDAARNLYARRAQLLGKYEDVVTDSDIMDHVVRETTGGIYNLEDQGSGFWSDDKYSIEAPAYGVDQDQFTDWLENLSEADITAMGNNTQFNKEITQAVNDQQVRLVTLGNGHYQVLRNGIPLVNDDLSPFILRWSQ